jgi:hypothetical protein
MAKFIINLESSDYSVENSSVVTDCSSSFLYEVSANQGDVIDISISGNNQGDFYTLNGVKTSFTNSIFGIVFNNTLVIGFNLGNSGSTGVFHEAEISIRNNSSADALPYTNSVIRKNDAVDCGQASLTANPNSGDNHVAVFTSSNNLEGTDDLTYDGTTLDVTGEVLATSIAVDGGLPTQYLMADGSVSLGSGGAGTGDLSFEHNQSTVSATWLIAHNLGKHPSVSVVDSAGTSVVGIVEYVNLNYLAIKFNDPFSGYAYMN